MSLGTILLIITGLLVLFGVGQRVLDRLRLTDRQALLFIALIIAGGFLPDVRLSERFSFNIGGALIPLLLCVWLFVKADTPSEKARRKMQLEWGVLPLQGYQEDSTENIVSHAMYVVKREKLVKPGDMVVITAGDPATNMVRGKGNMTNMMHVIQAF